MGEGAERVAVANPLPDAPVPTERISRLRAELLTTPYSICFERPTLIERFRRSDEGRRAARRHPQVRRAMELAFIMSQRRPRIYPAELIIGNMTSKRIAANYYPEGGSVNVALDLLGWERRTVPLVLTPAEKRRLAGLALRHIRTSVAGRALLRPGRLAHFLDFFRAKRYFVTEEAGIAHQVGGYRLVVEQGLQAVEAMAREALDAGRTPEGSPLSAEAVAFYEAAGVTIDGIGRMAANLAAAAEQAAEAEPDAARRVELLAAAAACRHVPYRPARTLHEGLQACWLVHLALNLEDYEQGLSFGRLDQILYPLYREDLLAGRLTPDEAVELLASFCLKTCETIPLYSERVDQYFSGFGVAQGITLGGTDAAGNDVTNELSGLFLDAYAQVRTREPALHVRIHPGTPDRFLDRAAAAVQLGCGKPSFFGDGAVVGALEAAGMTTEDARDYAVIGCVEMGSQGRTYNSSDAALFNLPLCLELALNQGRRFSGRGRGLLPGRLGAPTPPVSELRSFADVVEAFRAQVEDGVEDLARVITWLEETYRTWRTTPVNSIITEGCLARGRDVTGGGARYDYTSIQCAGLADAGDSLYALNRLVFEEKRLSLGEFVRILQADFRGHEALRVELATRYPRYGNGQSEADRMTQLAADVFAGAVTARRNSRGGRYIPGFYSMTCHYGFGRLTGALPNGRPAGRRLSNGLSPVDGADRRGPTALLRSAAALDSRQWANCVALNLKFDAAVVQGQTGRRALVSLLRTYFDHGGMQVQVNVLDAGLLRAAQADPSAHPGIVVRVAGYCAYFSDLQPAVQDEIIERTAHGL